jgi:hypothetical protein
MSTKAYVSIAIEASPADVQDGAFSYQYKLKPGVNTNSHAIVSRMPYSGSQGSQE